MKGEIIILVTDADSGITQYAIRYLNSIYPIPAAIAWQYNLTPGLRTDYTLATTKDESDRIPVQELGIPRNGIGIPRS